MVQEIELFIGKNTNILPAANAGVHESIFRLPYAAGLADAFGKGSIKYKVVVVSTAVS